MGITLTTLSGTMYCTLNATHYFKFLLFNKCVLSIYLMCVRYNGSAGDTSVDRKSSLLSCISLQKTLTTQVLMVINVNEIVL